MYTQHTPNVHLGWAVAVVLAALAAFWGGCAPASDPRAMVAQGKAYLDATEAAKVEETQKAFDRAMKETERMRATEHELELEKTRLALTAQAMNLEGTRFAAQQTAYLATADAAQAMVNYMATGTVKLQEAGRENARRNREIMMDWLWGLVLAGTAALAVCAAWLVVRARIEIWRREKVAWIERARAYPALEAGAGRAIDDRVIDLEETSYSSQLVDFLELARRINGRTSNMIPRYSRMGMSHERWDRFVRPLVRMQAVVTEQGRYTLVTQEYGNITGLIDAIQGGELGVRSSPTPPVIKQRTHGRTGVRAAQ